MNDHDLLIRIDERVHKSDDRMKRIEATLKHGEVRFKDHDDEIKEIRTWKNKITGALTLLGISTTGIIVVIMTHLPFGNK